MRVPLSATSNCRFCPQLEIMLHGQFKPNRRCIMTKMTSPEIYPTSLQYPLPPNLLPDERIYSMDAGMIDCSLVLKRSMPNHNMAQLCTRDNAAKVLYSCCIKVQERETTKHFSTYWVVASDDKQLILWELFWKTTVEVDGSTNWFHLLYHAYVLLWNT